MTTPTRTQATNSGRLTVTDTAGDGCYSVLRRAPSSVEPDVNVRDPEFAARLAASWNACAGVPPDVLEQIDVAAMLTLCREFVDYYRERGAHQLGNGKAFQTWDQLRAALGDER